MCGVSLDSVEENRAFAEKFAFPFPLLCDTDAQMSVAFGAASGPDDQYASRYTFVIGADGVVEQAIDTKDPAGQAAALLESIG